MWLALMWPPPTWHRPMCGVAAPPPSPTRAQTVSKIRGPSCPRDQRASLPHWPAQLLQRGPALVCAVLQY